MDNEIKEILGACICIRSMIEKDIKEETDIITIAELCLEWAKTNEEIKYLLKDLNDL